MAYYDNVVLEKSMYQSNHKSFSDILEEADPSTSYSGTPLAELDAFERQLKRFDIKVKGFGSDEVAKFFQTSQSATLFPEYVKRCVVQGIESANILKDIIATNTKINALDYRPIASITTQDDKELKKVAEGAIIPSTEIRIQENLVKLTKRGRMLVSSYEAIKFQRLDLFAVTLKQIGTYIAKSQLQDAISVILNGDGNFNEAQILNVSNAGQLTYEDLITLWSKFENYDMNRLLVAPDVMAKMLSIAELKDPATGLNFQGTGKLSTPLGATLYRSDAVPAGKIIALDKSCALEMVTASDVSIEHDKLIDRQLERASITSTAGFAKIFSDASMVMAI